MPELTEHDRERLRENYVAVVKRCAWCGRKNNESLEPRSEWDYGMDVVESHTCCSPPCPEMRKAGF